ncbi:MAG: riboflavin synthase [Terriglobales bacterium]
MFTGIIEEVGRVVSIVEQKKNRRLTVASSQLVKELKKGDSIAVSGVCLTAVEIDARSFSADLAQETWARTSFSRIKPKSLVNLELPLRSDGRFGGHIVQGHVDGVGTFVSLARIPDADDYWLTIEVPNHLARYIVLKGSICIEGISLTVAKVEETSVALAIIPHTVTMTNLKSLQPGDTVNLETDIIAKYVEKMMRPQPSGGAITLEKLVREGF